MTTKPQHEQDCETARAGIDCTDPYACASAVGALSRLHSEAAKVPGLESALRLAKEVLRDTGGAIADIVGHPRDNESGDDLVASVRSKVSGLEADNAALLKGISTYHEAWKQGRDVVPLANLLKVAESHGPGAALLERIAKAESERDELRSDLNKNFALGQADHRAIHDALGWAHGWHGKTLPAPWRGVTALIQERDTARERVATLEKLAYLGDHHFPDATWKARCEETVTDLRAAEARVKELTAQLAGARNAALEEAANLLDNVDSANPGSLIRALASQPPPAPAQVVMERIGMPTLATADAKTRAIHRALFDASEAGVDTRSAIFELNALETTPTPPALVVPDEVRTALAGYLYEAQDLHGPVRELLAPGGRGRLTLATLRQVADILGVKPGVAR